MTEIFRRYIDCPITLREGGDAKKANSLSMLASTANPVDWGGWREVLNHDGASCDMSAARALLINHRADQLAGPLTKIAMGRDGLDVDADILDDARMASGVRVSDAVRCGALRGVSIGYSYDRADTSFDEETRTLTVRKWRLLETSLTPIPADKGAYVRSLPFDFTSAAPPADNQERKMPDPIKPETQGSNSAPTPPAVVPNDKDLSESVRAETIREAREVAAIARSVGLNSEDFLGLTKAEAQDKMIRAMADKNKTPEPAQPIVTDFVDVADKARDAMAGALMHASGRRDASVQPMFVNNPLIGRSIQGMIRRYAAMVGLRTEDWDKNDVAYFALGQPHMMSSAHGRAANVVSGMFPNFVFLNAITKIIAKGYEAGAPTAKYRPLVANQVVPDFKQFSIGALGMANLVKTAEDAVFPELDKAEGVYNSTAKMWGGTISLSLQALVNDDTGQFNRHLAMAGTIADKTIDKRVFQKLLMGTSTDEATSTWTSNTTSNCSPVWTTADTLAAARAKVNAGLVALMNKTGLDSNPLGTMARFFVAGPTAGAYIAGLRSPAPGQTVGNAFAGEQELIVSPWLESSLAGHSTTTFYAVADPNEVSGLVLSKVAGFENIQVMPYDAGATAALKWKLWIPFEADLAYLTVGSTATIAAAQQCTT